MMKAIVMVGGFGTRLRPLTCNLPKPMVLVGNKPILYHIVKLLKRYDFTDITMMLYFYPDVITSYFGDGKKFGVNIKYIRPDIDLGTAGCVKFGARNFDEPFLVISGDLLVDFDLKKAYDFHIQKNSNFTIVLTKVVNPLDYGVIITDSENRITKFLEKPSWSEVFSDMINTGIYIITPDILKFIPDNQPFDFSKNLFPLLMKKQETIHGFLAEGYWKDIGNLDEYISSHKDILDGRLNIEIGGKKVQFGSGEVFLDKNVSLAKGVSFYGVSLIGKNCKLAEGVKVENSIIGDGCKIGANTVVKDSILWNNVTVGKRVHLDEDVICSNNKIGNNVTFAKWCIVSENCQIGNSAKIKAGVKIWPNKVVEPDSILSEDMIWREIWPKKIFTTYGICGIGNKEIIPEFSTRLGAAFGAYLGKGSYVITSRDAHKASRMIKRTMISGLLSAGVKVGDLRRAPIPVVRYEIGKENESGGLHVCISPDDPSMIVIKFFGRDGSDLTPAQEKEIENLFARGDFSRAPLPEVGEIINPPQAFQYYCDGYLHKINSNIIRKMNARIAIDYAYSPACLIFPTILGRLGLEVVSLNAYMEPEKITYTKEDIKKSLHELSHIVTTLKLFAGFLIDNSAERVWLIDEKGKRLSPEVFTLFLTYLVMSTYKSGKILLPVNTTKKVEKLKEKVKTNVEIVPTKISRKLILQESKKKGVIFAADNEGRFIFPEFQPAFDSMYTIGKTMEMLAELNFKVHTVVEQLPEFKLAYKKISCPWDKKGWIMRELIRGGSVETIDGVKIHYPDGWALVLPDEDGAFLHVWMESKDGVNLRRFSNRFIFELRKKLKEKPTT